MWPFTRTPDLITQLRKMGVGSEEALAILAQGIKQLGEDEAIGIAILERCNFELARETFGEFFRAANRDAARSGEQAVFKEAFVSGWSRFEADPNRETAKDWIRTAAEVKPMIIGVLFDCCPGGRFYGFR